jgi:hypothetical protein
MQHLNVAIKYIDQSGMVMVKQQAEAVEKYLHLNTKKNIF